jgi:SAM-dependent methyltransferase
MAHGSLANHNYQNMFDTVIATEVIEHLPNLWDELKNIMGVLTNDGIAVFTTLMTNAFIDTPNEQFAFRKWWYKDDLTHVSFFCNRSLAKLAELGHFKIDVYGDNNSSNTVVIYKNKIV